MKAQVAIKLTDEQLAELQPIGYAQQDLKPDDKFMLLGQVYFTHDGVIASNAYFVLVVGEKAEAIQKMLDPKPKDKQP